MDYHPDYNLDLASTIKAAMVNMCGEPHIAAHLPLAPAVTPMEPQNRPPPAEPLSSYKSFATLETVPYSFDQTGPTAFAEGSVEPPVPYTYQETGFSENGMWPMHPHSKLGMYNQGQLRGQVRQQVNGSYFIESGSRLIRFRDSQKKSFTISFFAFSLCSFQY